MSIALILACLFTYTESTPFPGLAAVPPCIAAAILISIGENGPTTVGSFLYWPTVVFIGTISYSLYLWHWPIILFLRLGIVPEFGVKHSLTILSVVLSLALATVSWRFVEQPFRSGRWKALPRSSIFKYAGVSAAVISVVAGTFIVGNGLPGRFTPEANIVGNYLFGDSTRRPGWFVENSFADFDAPLCLAYKPRKMNVLLLGDSHADALWFSISNALPEANVLQATGSTCPPIKDFYDRSPCGLLRRFVYRTFLPRHDIDVAILTEAWKSEADLAALEPALRWFQARHIPVIVVGPVPEYTAPLPVLLAFAQKWHLPNLAEHRLVRRMGVLDTELGLKIAGRAGIRYASIWRAICPEDRCQQYVDRQKRIPMLFDDNHLTSEGATLAIQRMQATGVFPR